MKTKGNHLKFRAFDERNQEMRYSDKHDGEFYINTFGVLYMYAIPKSESGLETMYYKNYDVMEFTGRVDDFNRDIYENDIVEQKIQSEFLDESDWKIIVGKVVKIDGEWCINEKCYPLFAFSVVVLGNTYDDAKEFAGF